MGDVKQIVSVLRFATVFSRHAELFEWAVGEMSQSWGPLAVEGEPFPFDYTSYYEGTMGKGIVKRFYAFEVLVDPSELADWKKESNAWEVACADRFPECRPLNIDPGYITEAKLVLATTKDRDHRIYLRDGIFAEVTLFFHRGSWQTRPWTYPDYADSANIPFFERCRGYLRKRLREE
ncbi:MAG TPA: DUF4416 family protein [Planctomycetaceae bacterium]|nr:DUF4416 family protein [Planctomycetaceae bacterium]